MEQPDPALTVERHVRASPDIVWRAAVEALEQHRAMGFEAGRGAAADQLEALAEA